MPLPRHAGSARASRTPTRRTCGSRPSRAKCSRARSATGRSRDALDTAARALARRLRRAPRRAPLRHGAQRAGDACAGVAVAGCSWPADRCRPASRRRPSSWRFPPAARSRCPSTRMPSPRCSADEARGRRYFPGYRVREQQIRMAREFARVLSEGGRLLLEGGTGVGKSLAYLAAAIPFAMERAPRGIREPVVVSTRTKLLQDQLLGKDIPAAAAMFGYPELRALSIKGRANYVCARRLERGAGRGARAAASSPTIASPTRCSRPARGRVATARWGRCRRRCSIASRRCASCGVARWRRAPSSARASSARTSAAAPSGAGGRRSPTRTSWWQTTICCCAGLPTTRTPAT